jgi:hypothetical protein
MNLLLAATKPCRLRAGAGRPPTKPPGMPPPHLVDALDALGRHEGGEGVHHLLPADHQPLLRAPNRGGTSNAGAANSMSRA